MIPSADTAPSVDLSLAESGLPHIPGYRIVGRVGSGGMGTVFEAVQESLRRRVAIKVLPPERSRSPHFVSRFQREAAILAQFSHPGIVRIIDRGTAGETFYLVMEFIAGPDGGPAPSLRSILSRRRLTPAEVLRTARGLSSALSYAHERGVIHRDLKPTNILLDESGAARVVDFGIAHFEDADALTLTGDLVGTPQYMAPEQRNRPGDVDHRADVFSFGIVVYEMLTGLRPEGVFELPSRLVSALDPRWDEIVLRAVQQSPERRFAGMSEIEARLRDLGQPAPPVPAVVGRCTACGIDNKPEASFCSGCGRSVRVACPGCATENRIGSKFCGSCGRDIQKASQIQDLFQALEETKKIAADAPFPDRRAALVQARDVAAALSRLGVDAGLDAEGRLRELWTARLARPEPDAYARLRELRDCASDLPDGPGSEALRALEEERRALLARLTEDFRAKKYAQVLRPAAGWERDPDIEAIQGRATAARERAKTLVKEQLPSLLQTRSFGAMKTAIQELMELAIPVAGLDTYAEQASKRIQGAEALSAEAARLRAARDLDGALARYARALSLCSDCETARTGHADATQAKNRCLEAAARAEEHFAAGQWGAAQVQAGHCVAECDHARCQEILDHVAARMRARSLLRKLAVAAAGVVLIAVSFFAWRSFQASAGERMAAEAVQQGEAELKRRRYAEAEAAFRRALEADPSHAAAQEGLERIERLRKTAAELAAAAEERRKAGDFRGAREKAEACLGIDPNHAAAHRVLGECVAAQEGAARKRADAKNALAAGDAPKARALYEECLQLVPDDAEAAKEREELLAFLESLRKKLAVAAEVLRQALPREAMDLAHEVLNYVPNDPEAMKIRSSGESALVDATRLTGEGDAHYAEGRHEDARRSYQEALRANAQNAHAADRIRRIDQARTSVMEEPPESEPLAWFPLEGGNEWVYQGAIQGEGAFELTRRVAEAEATISGTRCRAMKCLRTDGVEEALYFANSKDGVRWVGFLDNEGLHVFSTPLVFLKAKLGAGEVWNSQSRFGEGTVTLEGRVAGIGDEIKLPAGTFRGLVRVSLQATGFTSGVRIWSLWLADGLGLVRMEQRIAVGKTERILTLELDRYRLPSRGVSSTPEAKGEPGRLMDPAILDGLRWLSRHQLPNGAWANAKCTTRCGKIKGFDASDLCTPSRGEENTVGLTALTLLAFLGAGYAVHGQDLYDGINFGDCIRKGVRFLLENVSQQGVIALREEEKPMYAHAVATYALARVLRSFGGADCDGLLEPVRETVERAVALLVKGRGGGCKECGGKGRSTEKCGRCGGTAKCGACNGAGHRHAENCGVCDGVVAVKDSPLICASCLEKGSGKCGPCGGSGTLGGRSCSSCSEKLGVCRGCAGSGMSGDRACALCLRTKRGTGKCIDCKKTGFQLCRACRGQPKYGASSRRGWRYEAASGDSDSSVTAWCLTALHAAQGAGVAVDKDVVEGVFAWIDEMTESPHGRVGYTHKGTGKVYVPGLNDQYDHHESLTAAAASCRLLWGNGTAKTLAKQIEVATREAPSGDGNSRDSYYWYHATVLLSQIRDSRWNSWKSSVSKVIRDLQVRDEGTCRLGSWPIEDRWGAAAGRVYVTAIHALTLEYVTLASVFDVKKAPPPQKKTEPVEPVKWVFHLTGDRKIRSVSYEEKDGKYHLVLPGGGRSTLDKSDVVRIESASD